MSWTFCTGSFPDGLMDLENMHDSALDGARTGFGNRKGKERELHDDSDKDENNPDNVPGAHD